MYYYFFPLISRTGIFPLKQSWTHRRPPLPSPPGRGAGSSPRPAVPGILPFWRPSNCKQLGGAGTVWPAQS